MRSDRSTETNREIAMTEAETLSGSPVAGGPSRTPRIGSNLVDVTFAVPARGTRSIHLAGDFNDWSATSHPMTLRNGQFHATLALAAGARHRYQFFVDGERWENDWAADDYEEINTGAYVSIVDIA